MRPRRSMKRDIKRMVDRIVERFGPEKVILFGSLARDEGGPDSDVDLLVVMDVEGCKRAKQLELRVSLHDVRVPKDVIVSSPEDFEWRKEIVGTIERVAAREGRVLYDASS